MIQWLCNYKNSPPILERTKQRVVYVALYNTVTDLWRKRGFAILKRARENTNMWATLLYKSGAQMMLSLALCSLWQQIIMSWVQGWWVCRHKGQSMLVAGTPQIRVYWMFSSAWHGTHISLRQYAMYIPAFRRPVVTRITYLLTNVYLLSYVFIYLHLHVFDPFFIYCLLSTFLRLFNFLHHYILIFCFLHFLYIYIFPLRRLWTRLRHTHTHTHTHTKTGCAKW